MTEARFGENFSPDATNRMDTLREIEDVPEYVDFGLSLRKKLKNSIDSEGWPEYPEEASQIEDLFDSARDAVSERWVRLASPEVEKKMVDLLVRLPEDKKNEELRKVLADPEALEESFKLQQFGVLESVRTIDPELWRSLVMASSERQLASVALMRKWVKDAPAENFSNMNLSKAELEVFLDLAGVMGKYIDHAYIKQVELADAPGGSSETKLGSKTGAQHVYDVYKSEHSNEIDIKPYSEVFPFEFKRISSRFVSLADRIDKLLITAELPDKYQDLSNFLRQLGGAYGSTSNNPKELDKMWTATNEKAVELAEKGLPIVIIPQGAAAVAGEAEKVDIELRLGLRTENTEKMEEVLRNFGDTAEAIIDEHRDALANPEAKVPKTNLNVQPYAFGPNLFYYTEGESGMGVNIVHTNASEEMAVTKQLPLVEKVFGTQISKSEYRQAVLVDVALHETAHAIMDSEDKAVKKRIGQSSFSATLEELKAEALSMRVLKEGFPKEWEPERDKIINDQCLAKLGSVCGYLAHKSSDKGSFGERYYYTGVAIMSELLDRGAIVKDNDHYKIVNPEETLSIIADKGSEVLDSFYANVDQDPTEVKKGIKSFDKEIRSKEKEPAFQDFLAVLKSK